MNREEFEIHEQDFRFFRTSCGLMGFILFFVGTFLSFIIYSELDEYSAVTFILGGVSLLFTLVFFFCVLNESRKIILPVSSDGMELEPLISQQSSTRQPEPELNFEQQPEPELQPHWGDKTRMDFKYVRNILGMPPGKSDETVESETSPESDIVALQQMTNPGSSTIQNPTCELIPNLIYEPAPDTSKTSQDLKGSIPNIECDTIDVENHPQKASTSIVDEGNSKIIKSKPDISPLKGLFSISSSDSAKSSSTFLENQTEDVSAKSGPSTDSEMESESKM